MNLTAIKQAAQHIADILADKRESDDSTIHAGNTAFISLERWAARILEEVNNPADLFVITSDEYHDNEQLFAAFTDKAEAERAIEVGFPGCIIHHTEIPLNPEIKPAVTWHFHSEQFDTLEGETKVKTGWCTKVYYNGGQPDEEDALRGNKVERLDGKFYEWVNKQGWGLTQEAAEADYVRRHGPITPKPVALPSEEW